MATPALVRPHPGGSGGAGLINYIDRTALVDITRGQLCVLSNSNYAVPASSTGNKAVGIATRDTPASSIVRIQVFGIFENFPFTSELIGATYYQDANGEATPIPSSTNIPAFVALGGGNVNILDDTGASGGGPVPGTDGVIIQAVTSGALLQGELCEVQPDGTVNKAMQYGEKAIGFCLADTDTGAVTTIQVNGVLNGYSLFSSTPAIGIVYYQSNDGLLQASPTKYPACITISESKLLILTDTGITSAFAYVP